MRELTTSCATRSLKETDVTEQLIEDTYNEIFLQALDTRQSRAVFE